MVTQYTSSSLTLRALLKSAAGRLGMGATGRPVAGLTDPAKGMFAATAAARDFGVVVVPTDADVERLTVDARFFLAATEGLSDAEVERSVLPFPSHEVDPYRGLAPHFDIASARARTLHAIVMGGARLVVASAASLLPKLSPPDRLQQSSLAMVPGQEISPVDLADLLAAAGYTRQDPVDEAGEFCVRGGVVDFYPADATRPIRLEFVGDTIESMRTYDPATQRSTGTIDQAAIVPLTELPGDPDNLDRSATLLDYLSAAGRPIVFVSEPDEVRAQGARFWEQVQAGYRDTVARGQRAAEPRALMFEWDAASAWLDLATRLETLAIAEDEDGRAVHIACQPALEFNGRLPEWVAEIRRG